ncbi:unnamed protein product, partial [Prorocentrum cordatum]
GHARVRRQGRRRPRLPRDGAPAEGGPACERREEGDHGQLSEDLAARRARHVPSYPMMAGDEDLEAPAHQQPSRARRVASLNRLFKAHEERQREEMAQRRRELQEAGICPEPPPSRSWRRSLLVSQWARLKVAQGVLLRGIRRLRPDF